MAREKKPKVQVQPFVVPAGDPLANEHAIVGAFVDEAVARWGDNVSDLKTLPSGNRILGADHSVARLLLLAAVARLVHWDHECERVRDQAENETERWNPHFQPGWDKAGPNRRHTEAVIIALMRRTLPLTPGDLQTIVRWCNAQGERGTWGTPYSSIVRAIERVFENVRIEEPIRSELQKFVERLQKSGDKEHHRLAAHIEQLLGREAAHASVPKANSRPLVQEIAGNPVVLVQLKRYLGFVAQDEVPVERIAPDQFALRADSPLQEEHRMLTALLQESVGGRDYSSVELMKYEAGKKMLLLKPAALGRLILAAAERKVSAVLHGDNGLADMTGWRSRYTANSAIIRLMLNTYSFERDALFDFILFLSAQPGFREIVPTAPVLAEIDEKVAQSPLSEGERYTLSLWRSAIVRGALLGNIPPNVAKLNSIIGDGMSFYLSPDEQWSLLVNEDVAASTEKQQPKWVALLKHWLTATASRPSDKWLKTNHTLVSDLGEDRVARSLAKWLAIMPRGRVLRELPTHVDDTRTGGDVIEADNANCLRGMLWTVPTLKKGVDDLTRIVATVAQSAYKKIPGVGPRAVKVGNAAVYSLSEMGTTEAVGQLAMLKVRVKFGTAQKEIEKAFNTSAEALGLPRDQIEELGVPTYGLEEVGRRTETLGDATAEIRIEGGDVALHWTAAGGKALKSVPAKVKAEFKEELKELQGAVKDIAAMLPAQSQRLDSTFLLQKKWPIAQWRERYLDHPLIGTLARRLIWTSGKQSFAWRNEKLVDVKDRPVELPETAEISLWHPIDQPTEEVLAWREWTQRHEVKQPFKQAHREVYLLTEAERRTNTYSNRFAAHVIRQHQFNALCAARGWKNKLRLMVDDTYPPASRELPLWNLRAEYWIEGIGDDYGTDTNESGTYLRLATDQVRFYRTTAAQNSAHAGGGGYESTAAGPGTGNLNEPLPLDQIPPLVLSEILRDVDLFVGVASVGNDPTWQDGGPEGRYRTYWQNYSFGDLSETAKTRKAVLETLLPRLTKLKGKWSLNDKFLVIQGSLRTYKIHLGSGNILMEPNDQYLCIVADRSTKANENVFLPFEGDATLSIILSKAFLLAADEKITDVTITRQIGRGK